MDAVKAPGELLGVLKRHERVIARLYEIYSQKFPKWEEFWMGLAGEEHQHADWIGALQARVEESGGCFVVNRFPIGAVEHSIAYVEDLAEGAADPNFLLMNAVSTALYLEKALIENKYFEVFSGDGAEVKRVLNALTHSTRDHYQRLHALWQSLK